MLWIDARERPRTPSAADLAAHAFEMRFPGAGDQSWPQIIAVELDDGCPAHARAVCAAILDAVSRARARRPCSTAPAVDYIEANLAGRVSLDGAARACRLSACELSRRFHREHGETFSAYLLRRRVERARELLADGERSVSAVAYAVGFNDLSYFARVFRREVGMPASEYLSRLQAGAAPSA